MYSCSICKEKVDIENYINFINGQLTNLMHGKCYMNLCKNYKSKIELEKKQPLKCVVCNKTLPPKTTKNYHKKCILEQQKQEEKRNIITVYRDLETCTVQY